MDQLIFTASADDPIPLPSSKKTCRKPKSDQSDKRHPPGTAQEGMLKRNLPDKGMPPLTAQDCDGPSLRHADEAGEDDASFARAIDAASHSGQGHSINNVLPETHYTTRPSITLNTEAIISDKESDTAIAVASLHDGNATMLDPTASARQYYRETHTGVMREIWRPGDGDGKSNSANITGNPAALPIQDRWRLYQLQTGSGPVSKQNAPPKYVLLDDRAAKEVFGSDLPRSHICKFWPHDFSHGQIRARRPHRGRPAIRDSSADGNAQYWSAPVGKEDLYYFIGETDYKPIIYNTADANHNQKRKPTSPAHEEDPTHKKQRHHNQHTPAEQMVKNGAPSLAKGKHRYRARLNPFLLRSPSPPWSKNRSKLYGGVGERSQAHAASVARPETGGGFDAGKSIRQESDERISTGQESGLSEDAGTKDNSEQDFPFARAVR